MKLGHVHLKVSDLQLAEKFYSELIGLKVTERVESQFVFMSFAQAHHDLALQQASEELSTGGSLYHVAFEVPDANSLLDVIERFEKEKLKITLVDHQISWAAYSRDPDGNGVEIYLDRRKTGSSLWKGRSNILSKEEIIKAGKNES